MRRVAYVIAPAGVPSRRAAAEAAADALRCGGRVETGGGDGDANECAGDEGAVFAVFAVFGYRDNRERRRARDARRGTGGGYKKSGAEEPFVNAFVVRDGCREAVERRIVGAES